MIPEAPNRKENVYQERNRHTLRFFSMRISPARMLRSHENNKVPGYLYDLILFR
jgi:hypothetical protein